MYLIDRNNLQVFPLNYMLKFPREREYQKSIVFVGARYKHVRAQDKS